MQLNDIRAVASQFCQIAALFIAVVAGLKLFGLVSVRPPVIELAAVAIALAQV